MDGMSGWIGVALKRNVPVESGNFRSSLGFTTQSSVIFFFY